MYRNLKDNFCSNIFYILLTITVSEHMGWVRNVVLMNVYFGFWEFGGGNWDRGGQFTSNLRLGWTDPVTARRVPSK
jgi:hypothetical protein